jgi:hypothetical protein
VARRLAVSPEPGFLTAEEFETLTALAGRIVPQPASRPPIPVAALVDRKLLAGERDGYRIPTMPQDGQAWRHGLAALDAESRHAFGDRFARLPEVEQNALLRRAEAGELTLPDWGEMPAAEFFKRRLLRDVVQAYYAHPAAWSQIGWGGPASPRGYVRLGLNDRDPWEPQEAGQGDIASVVGTNRDVR